MATLFIYDLVNENISVIEENFKTHGCFSSAQALSWSFDKIAFIELNQVSIFNITEKDKATTIPFDRPTSVVFSDNGDHIAIGGEKAILYKLK